MSNTCGRVNVFTHTAESNVHSRGHIVAVLMQMKHTRTRMSRDTINPGQRNKCLGIIIICVFRRHYSSGSLDPGAAARVSGLRCRGLGGV